MVIVGMRNARKLLSPESGVRPKKYWASGFFGNCYSADEEVKWVIFSVPLNTPKTGAPGRTIAGS